MKKVIVEIWVRNVGKFESRSEPMENPDINDVQRTVRMCHKKAYRNRGARAAMNGYVVSKWGYIIGRWRVE